MGVITIAEPTGHIRDAKPVIGKWPMEYPIIYFRYTSLYRLCDAVRIEYGQPGQKPRKDRSEPKKRRRKLSVYLKHMIGMEYALEDAA